MSTASFLFMFWVFLLTYLGNTWRNIAKIIEMA